MVAQRQRGHLQLGRARGQLRNAARAIEQAVLGMDVEMDEGFRRGHESNLIPIWDGRGRNYGMNEIFHYGIWDGA